MLDFGLAKALDEAPAQDSNPANSPTLVAGRSLPGLILGTASYMSPEQARGANVDKRTDIWAFGVVLYEMLTAQRLFEGETISDTLAQVLTKEPNLDAIPVNLRPILERCLQRDRKQRLRDIGDVWLLATTSHQSSSQPARRPWLLPILAAVALAVLLLAAGTLLRPPHPAPPLRLALHNNAAGLPNPFIFRSAQISPDGRWIAHGSQNGLVLHDLREGTERVLEATKGAAVFFWSPDSAELGFVSGGKLQKVPIPGGTVAVLGSLNSGRTGIAGDWSPDGLNLLLADADGLHEIPARGGTFKDVFAPKEMEFLGMEPCYLPAPHTRSVVTSLGNFDDDHQIVILNLDSGARKVLLEGRQPVYSPTGHIVYRARQLAGGLWAVPFNLSKLELAGEPFPLAPESFSPTVSNTGALLYVRDPLPPRVLGWRDRKGNRLSTVGGELPRIIFPELSPDGKFVLHSAHVNGSGDLFLVDIERNVRTRFASGPENTMAGHWHPDGRSIAFDSGIAGKHTLELAALLQSDRSETILHSQNVLLPTSWSPDGQALLYQAMTKGRRELRYLLRKSDGTGYQDLLFPANEGSIYSASFSPDGKHVVYNAVEAGSAGAFIRDFPSGAERHALTENASMLRWSRDGKEIYYVKGGDLYAVPVSTANGVRTGTPEKLFTLPDLTNVLLPQYDVLPGGQRFLFVEPTPGWETRKPTLHLVLNWVNAFVPNSRQP